MSVKKRTYDSGKTVWYYIFDAPGSTKENRRQIKESGFATKGAATDAEAQRRTDEKQKHELAKVRGPVDAPLPKTLGMLLKEFFAEHADKKLAPKTVERYREQAAYLAPELLTMPLADVTALHLSREWNRLSERGGHHRKTKEARPLSSKTVRNIAGVLSSAFARAIKWGLVTMNPVSDSEPPKSRKKEGVALTPQQQALLLGAAESPWSLPVFLELAAATGARRGEILALRWADICDGRAIISRSLTQTRNVLEFKGTKTEKPRVVTLPESALGVLNAHRKRQEELRRQYGPGYQTELDLIFANPDGTALKPDSVSSAVSALFRRLKLPKGASLHSLRHTHGSHLLAAGAELIDVSARLGHSSIYTTATVYAHAIHGRDDEAAKKWEAFQKQAMRSDSTSKPI